VLSYRTNFLLAVKVFLLIYISPSVIVKSFVTSAAVFTNKDENCDVPADDVIAADAVNPSSNVEA
jgi:hypothetical protein